MPLRLPAEVVGLEKSIEQQAKKAGKNLKLNLGTSAKSIEGLSQPLGRITGKADQFTKSMEAANARVLAFGASVGVLNTVTQAFKDLVTTTIQVEKQLASINTILGTTTSQLDSFKKTLFDVAKNTEQSFSLVSNAALELSRQGLKADEVTRRLNDSLILSRLSGLGASEAVAGLTAAINSFQKEGVTSAEVLNKLSAASIKAAVSEKDLIEGIKRSGSVATQAGVSLDELVGVISAVQERTARGGAVIGNSFKTIFTRIQSIDKLKTMQNLGVQITNASGDILSGTQLIQNLGKAIETLPDAKKLQIAENLVGKFQIAPFLAILEDYNSETSKAIEITKVAQGAFSEAYDRNIALNETLSAAINSVVVNLQDLANTLGGIGITDNLKNILDFFNTLTENIKGTLDGEGAGSTFAKGIVKGIGAVLSGPGLAIFGAILARLTIDLVKFGTGSLKTFFGLNKAAQEQKLLQGQIASTLLTNKGIQDAILAIERQQISAEEKKAQQTQFFTTALNEQLAVMQRMQGIAATVAPGVAAGTRRGRAAGGFIPNYNAVMGYAPNFSAESSDIAKGVGGAPRSARPVAIPNFNFGAGQRGTMVANTSEFAVPNFAGSGATAIFNQNMASTMGLPSGAKSLGAAGGFIPNFATFGGIESAELERLGLMQEGKGGRVPKSPSKIRDLMKGKNASPQLLTAGQALLDEKELGNTSFLANVPKGGGGFIMLLAQNEKFNQDGADKAFKNPFVRPSPNSDQAISFFEGASAGVNPLLKDADTNPSKKFRKLANLDEILTQGLEKGVEKTIGNILSLMKPSLKIGKENSLKGDSIVQTLEKGGSGAFGALRGSVFEKVMNLALGSLGDPGSELDVLIDNDREALELIFNLPEGQFARGDFKNSKGQRDKFISQVLGSKFRGVTRTENVRRKTATTKKTKTRRSASGFIPNFAVSPLDQAVQREASAGLPINQIRINQDASLRNSGNPMGLAVTNTRDEPTGAIPNFANGRASDFDINSINKSFKASSKAVDENTKKTKENVNANGSLITRFLLLQSTMTFLSAATGDASSGVGRLTNTVSDAIGTFALAGTAGETLSEFGNSMAENSKGLKGAFGSLISAAGTAVTAFGIFKGTLDGAQNIFFDLSGTTEENAILFDKLSKATDGVIKKFDELSKEEQLQIEREIQQDLGKATGAGGNAVKNILGAVGIGKVFIGDREERQNFAIDAMESGGAIEKAAALLLRATGDNIPTVDQLAKDSTGRGEPLFQTNILKGGTGRTISINQSDLLGVQELFKQARIAGISLSEFSDIAREAAVKGPDSFLFGEGTERGGMALEGIQEKAFLFNEVQKRIIENAGAETKRLEALSTFAERLGAEGRAEFIKGANRFKTTELIRQQGMKIASPFGIGDLPMGGELDTLRGGLAGGVEEVTQLKIVEQIIENINQFRVEGNDESRIALELAKAQISRTIEQNKVLRDGSKEEQLQLDIAKSRGDLSKEDERTLALRVRDEKFRTSIEQARLGAIQQTANQMKRMDLSLEQQQAITQSINDISDKDLRTKEGLAGVLTKILGVEDATEDSIQRQVALAVETNDKLIDRLSLLDEQGRKIFLANQDAERLKENLQTAAGRAKDASAQTKFDTTRGLDDEKSRLEREKAALQKQLNSGRLGQDAADAVRSRINVLGRNISLQSGARREAGLLQQIQGTQIPLSSEGFGILDRGAGLLGRGPVSETGRQNVERRLSLTENLGDAKDSESALNILKQARSELSVSQVEEIESLNLLINEFERKIQKNKEDQKSTEDLTQAQLDLISARQKELNILEREEQELRRAGFDVEAANKKRKADAIRDRSDLPTGVAARLGDMQRGVFSRLQSDTSFQGLSNFNTLADNIKSAAISFKDTMSDALVDAIAKGESLKDVLQSAATEFFNMMSKAFMQSAVDQLVGGFLGNDQSQSGGGGGGLFSLIRNLGKNSGGMIKGGSGLKDDVPALLTGGEFVMRRSAVEKFGPRFMESLNSGNIPMFNTGGLFTPGSFGQGSITGSRNLLGFSTQSFTGGKFDTIGGKGGLGFASLEPQSGRLTAFGRRNNPMFQREQQSKQEAFGLFARQAQFEAQLKEQRKQERKAFLGSILGLVGSIAISEVTSGLFGGGKAGKAIIDPGDVVNRIKNIEQSLGISTDLGGGPQGVLPPLPQRATGGYIAPSAGIDNVPAMLSGGEFVMNSAATQRIGRGNLAAINSGASGGDDKEAVINRLDQLIAVSSDKGETVVNITINSDGTETQDGNAEEDQQQLAKKIKDVVRQTIDDEKRLGGTLRRQ